MGQKYEASLAFLVENISSLLVFAKITLFKSLQFNQARAQFQSTIQATSHKLIESKQCMQACQTLFYLQKWFIIGYKHSKTLYWSFHKVAKLFAKDSIYKPFLNQIIILCGE